MKTMANEEYTVIAFWGRRKETFSDCSQRIDILVGCLFGIDNAFSHWFDITGILGKPYETVVLTKDRIEKLLLEYTRKNSRIIGNDGFVFNLNTHPPKSAISINIICGRGDSDKANNHVKMYFTMTEEYAKIFNIQNMRKLVQCIVNAMQPEWVSARPSRLIHMTSERVKSHPQIGWVTYLSRSQRIPTLALPSYSSPYGDGTLLIATEEPFSQLNLDHVALVNNIDEALVKAGIFTQGTKSGAHVRNDKTDRINRIRNPYSTQVDFVIEPWGTLYPMPPHAEFVVITHDQSVIQAEIKEHAIIVELTGDMELYYGDVRLKF